MTLREQRGFGKGSGSWLRLGRAAMLWTLATVVGVSVVGLATSDASWLGATDDRVASVAVETYAEFLRRVAWAIAQVALLEWGVIAIVTLGLLQLTATARDHRPSRRMVVHALHLASALTVTLVFWGYAVAQHPGLFLSLLASSRGVALFVESCRFVAPIVAVASLAGYSLAVTRASRSVQVLFGVLAVVVGWMGSRGCGSVRRYQADAPFTVAPVSRPTPSSTSEVLASAGPPPAPGPSSGAPASAAAPATTVAPSPPPRPSNVLWIAVDSLRPDKIDAKNTPNLAALLAESVYFPNTIVPVPRTGPSWSSALTSLGPLTSGVETMFPDVQHSNLSTVAMPAYLASYGYRTMVASEYAGEFFRRVKVGFETEAVPRAELMQISGQIMMSRAPLVLAQAGLLYGGGPGLRRLLPDPLEELIRGLPNFSVPDTLSEDIGAFLTKAPTSPAFILAFYSQPHFPYTSAPAFARRYRVPGSSAALAYGRDVTSERPVESDVDRRQIDALYRAALAESDAAIGRMLAKLRGTHWLDDTIVVLTADHGEGLYECPECVGHGDNLRGMMTLRVPLAIRLPARFKDASPSVQTHYVSLLDVYPTVTELLGMPALSIMEGQALLDAGGRVKPPPATPRIHMVETGEWLWSTSAVPKDRLEYPPITTLARLEGDRISIDSKYEGVIRAAKHRAAIRAPYKLTYEPSRAGVRWRLFDFEADPLDAKDLASSRPEILAELKEALRRSVVRHARMLPVGDYFLTRPSGVPEDHW